MNSMNTANTSKNSLSGFALGLALVGEVARYCARQAIGEGRGAIGGDVARYAGGKKGDGSKGDAKSNGEHWVTIGGEPEGDKKHVGGTPVKIDGAGNVVAGPAWVAKAGITELGGGKGGEGGGEKGGAGDAIGGAETGGEAAPAGTTGKFTGESHPGNGTIVKTKDGKEYMVMNWRHGVLRAAPIINGKPVVSSDTTVRFDVSSNHHGGEKADIYLTDRNIYREEEEKRKAASTQVSAPTDAPVSAPISNTSAAPTSPATPKASSKFELPKYKRDNPSPVTEPTVVKNRVEVQVPFYAKGIGTGLDTRRGKEYSLPGLEDFRFVVVPSSGKKGKADYRPAQMLEATTGLMVSSGETPEDAIASGMRLISRNGGAKAVDGFIEKAVKEDYAQREKDGVLPYEEYKRRVDEKVAQDKKQREAKEKAREIAAKRAAEKAAKGGKSHESGPMPSPSPTPSAAAPPAPAEPGPTAPASTPTAPAPSHITPETVPGKGSIVTDAAGREHVVTGSGGGYMFAAPIGDNGEVQGNRERAFNLKLSDRNSQAFATGRMHGVAQSKPASESAGESVGKSGGSGGTGGGTDASPSAGRPATPATPAPATTSASPSPTAPAATANATPATTPAEAPAATAPTPPTAPTNAPSASGEGKFQVATPKPPENAAESAPVASAATVPAAAAPAAAPAPTASPAPLSAADQAHHEAARKLGATPVAGSKPVRFSRTGLAKGDNGHANGSVHEINGKRYIQTDRTARQYLSRDDLDDEDNFNARSGGAYGWTGVEVEPNEAEKAYDAARATHAAAVKEREATVQRIKKALQNRENIPQTGPGNTRPAGMEPAWQSPRAPGSYAPSDVISTNGEHVELHQPVYDDAPMIWRAHNPELAKAAASLREPLHPPARPEGVRGPKVATFTAGGTGPKASIPKPVAPKPAAPAPAPTAPGHHEKMVSDRHAAQQPINTRGDTYNNKDALRALGARWNGDRKSWEFTPHKMTADQRKALVSQMDKLASKGVVFYSQRLAGSPTTPAPEKALYSMVASAFSSRFQATATATQATTIPHQRKGN